MYWVCTPGSIIYNLYLTYKLLLYADDNALIISGSDPQIIAVTLSDKLAKLMQIVAS